MVSFKFTLLALLAIGFIALVKSEAHESKERECEAEEVDAEELDAEELDVEDFDAEVSREAALGANTKQVHKPKHLVDHRIPAYKVPKPSRMKSLVSLYQSLSFLKRKHKREQ